MPYRAMLFTIITLGVAFVAIGMWLTAVAPLAQQIGTQNQGPATLASATSPHADAVEIPEKNFRGLIKAVLYLSFLLICMVLLIGIAASFRQWMLYSDKRKKIRTRYVNAWEIAGQRMQAAPPENDEDQAPPSED